MATVTPPALKEPWLPDGPTARSWNGAQWESYIWKYLKWYPASTSLKLSQDIPGLTRGASSGFLSKLVKRGQVAAVKMPENGHLGAKEVLHYSIACPEFVPAVRQRNRTVQKGLPGNYNFDQEDKPITLIQQSANPTVHIERREPVRFDPETFTENLSLSQGRELYDHLHKIYGVRK